MAPQALAQVLRPLRDMFRPDDYPRLLVGLEVSDDAAIYQISDDVAVIQTLDFFTPVVDDPYDYGAIAAANALSDIYAMGGEATLALNISAFPSKLPPKMISEILRGGAEKVREAGAVIAGGHTVDDEEPKYGLAVLGLVHPKRIFTKGGGQPGDALVLTKPLGAGLIATAFKGDAAEPEHLAAAAQSMKRLNRRASQLFQQLGVHACTDVTGFGLLGHSSEMAEKGGVRLRFSLASLPLLEGAGRYAEEWLFPGGSCRNQSYYAERIQFAPEVSEEMQMLLYTPETSGGLIAAVAPEKLAELRALFAQAGEPCWVVGEVLAGAGIEVVA
jgi:selenide, water dikinase